MNEEFDWYEMISYDRTIDFETIYQNIKARLIEELIAIKDTTPVGAINWKNFEHYPLVCKNNV